MVEIETGEEGAQEKFLVTEFQTYKNKENSNKYGEIYNLTYKQRNAELNYKVSIIYHRQKNMKKTR